MEPTSAVILAGGRSRRMGTDKRFLLADGRTLLERALALASSRCDEVLVAANDAERLAGLGVRIVPDRFADAGPIAGIHAGLCAAAHDLVLVVPVDAPWISLRLLDRLRAESSAGFDAVCGSTEAGVEPLVGYYRRSCVPAIESEIARGRRKVTSFFSIVRARVLDPAETRRADPDGRSFVNLNTPRDLVSVGAG